MWQIMSSDLGSTRCVQTYVENTVIVYALQISRPRMTSPWQDHVLFYFVKADRVASYKELATRLMNIHSVSTLLTVIAY